MVTYKSRADGHQDVLLEGKKVGVIKFFANGVRYKPKGRYQKYGALYPSLAALKLALESEEEHEVDAALATAQETK